MIFPYKARWGQGLLLLAVGVATAAFTSPRWGGASSGIPRSTSFLPNLTEVVQPSVTVGDLHDLVVDLKLELPENHTVNVEAPGRVAIRSPLVGDTLIAESPLDEPTLSLPLHWGSTLPTTDAVDLVIEAVVYYCEESKKSVCKIRSLRIFQPLKVDRKTGAKRLAIQTTVPDNA